MKQAEFRGCDSFVCAKIIQDDAENYVTGAVTELAPIASVAKTTESNSEVHWYDNNGMIQIKAVGADTVTFIVPALYLATLALVTGGTIDPDTGAYMSGSGGDDEYYAIGYRIKLTDGTYRYVWRLKGQFSSVPDENSDTESDEINTNNQEIVFTGTQTIHEFRHVGRRRDIVIDERDGKCDLTAFFDRVQTPETIADLALTAVTSLTLSESAASMTVGAAETLTATVSPFSSAVRWTSSTPAVAAVTTNPGSSKFATVTAIRAGTAVITAAAGTKSAACTVTVSEE